MTAACPTACVKDAAFAYVDAFRAHANVGFFLGAWLPDPAGLLEGEGKRMRHVKLRPGRQLNVVALNGLIVAGHDDIRRQFGTFRYGRSLEEKKRCRRAATPMMVPCRLRQS